MSGSHRAALTVDMLGVICGMNEAADVMTTAHVHTALELNYLYEGAATYLFGTDLMDLPARRLAIFWGQVPHMLLSMAPGSRFAVLTIPLPVIMQWRMGPGVREALLAGRMLIEEPPQQRHRVENELALQRWLDSSAAGELDESTLLLELHARLRRTHFELGVGPRQERLSGRPPRGIEEVFRFLASRYTEPVRLAEIADHVGLEPKYLSRTFKRATGQSLWQYLTQLRISHAQRLLVTTDDRPLDIAFTSGFDSASHFYETFRRLTRASPARYREDARGAARA